MAFCTMCGNELPDSGNFCTKCGTATGPTSPSPMPKPPQVRATYVGSRSQTSRSARQRPKWYMYIAYFIGGLPGFVIGANLFRDGGEILFYVGGIVGATIGGTLAGWIVHQIINSRRSR